MEILYPNGSLNHLEAMEADTIVHRKVIPKNFCPEAQDRAQALVCAWNSLLDLNRSAKRQLEFTPGRNAELGRWNKAFPSVPRFASWELQVPTGSCTRSQGSEIQEKDLHNWAQLLPTRQICHEVEGKIEAILWYFFPWKQKSSAHLPDSRGKVLFESLEATQRNGCCMCRHVPSNRNTSFHSTWFIPVSPSSQEHPAHGKE